MPLTEFGITEIPLSVGLFVCVCPFVYLLKAVPCNWLNEVLWNSSQRLGKLIIYLSDIQGKRCILQKNCKWVWIHAIQPEIKHVSFKKKNMSIKMRELNSGFFTSRFYSYISFFVYWMFTPNFINFHIFCWLRNVCYMKHFAKNSSSIRLAFFNRHVENVFVYNFRQEVVSVQLIVK